MTAPTRDPSGALPEQIASFPPRSQRVGTQLLHTAEIRFLRIGEQQVTGTVHARQTFTVELQFGPHGTLATRCGCPRQTRCEHAFALLLQEVHRRAQAAAQARVEPSATAVAPPSSPPKPKSAVQPKAPPQPVPVPTAKKPKPKPTPKPTPPPAWQQRLHTLLRAAQLDRRGAERQPVPITYRIDLAFSRSTRQLVVDLLMPRKPGGNKLQRLGGGLELSDFDLPTARLLRQLRDLSDAYRSSELPGSHQELTDPWASELLPKLFASGRVVTRSVVDDDDDVQHELELDRGEPFRFVPELRSLAEGRVLRAWLQRGDERLQADDLLVVFEQWAVTRARVIPILPAANIRQLAIELVRNGELRVPREAEAQAISHLAELSTLVPELSQDFAITDAAPPTPLFAIDTRRMFGGGHLGEVRHDYGDVVVGNDGERMLPPSQPDGPLRRRQLPAEQQAIARVLAASPHLLDTPMAGHALVPPKLLTEVVQRLTAAGIRVQVDERTLRTSRGTSMRIHTGIDWFELEGAVQFDGGAELPLGAALAAIDRGEHTLQLADGSHAMLPVEELRALHQASQLGERRGDRVRLRHSQTLLLDALLAGRTGIAATLDAGFRQLRDRLLPEGGVRARPAPASFRGTLRPYQELGLGWLHFLHELGLGGCLADDMGLGKTVQVLALLLAVHAEPRPQPTLLVVPRSLLDNWRREAQRFAPSLRLLDFHGADRWTRLGDAGFAPFDVVVTTYGTLRADAVQFETRAQRFEYVILDEAQAIENPTSVTSKAVRLLRAEHRLALTGTPVMNHLGELWALFEFLSPGLLGKSATFRQLLAAKSERAGGLDLQLLHRALAPFLLRRTKAAVLPDLPPKQEQAIWCELEGSQLQTYTKLRNRYQQALLTGDRQLGPQERFQVLEALLRLRQAACHEGLLHEDRRGASAKFDALLPMLHELAQSGHKALVFSQFTELLGLLRQQLEQRGMQYEYLDGQTRDRQARVDRFQQDGTCPLFLISLKAGGFGLNLTAADYVFLLDPWWNPAAEAQASDRAHRLGQTRPVTVYRLVCKGTVEEKVLELQARKQELVDAVLGADQSLLAKLTRDDLAALLA